MSTKDIFSPMKHLLEDERLDEGRISISNEDLRWFMDVIDRLDGAGKLASDEAAWYKRKIFPKYWRIFESKED